MVSFARDPFLVGPDEAVNHESDGLIVCRDGLIEAAGPYHHLRRELPADVPIAGYSGCIISAGFIDAHIHYVQTGIMAALSLQPGREADLVVLDPPQRRFSRSGPRGRARLKRHCSS